MKVLVFGGTGRVGQSVLEYALAGGHEVTAFVRNRARVTTMHERLSLVEGDIYSADTVRAAMNAGFAAVINVIGGDVFKASTLVTDGARILVGAMQQVGLSRYLGITGIAEMRPRGLGGITQRILRLSPLKHAVRDHDAAWDIVRESGLNYTLAGCPYIKDGAHKGNYHVVPDTFPGGFHTISPQDVADFLVRELAAAKYSRRIIGIWY